MRREWPPAKKERKKREAYTNSHHKHFGERNRSWENQEKTGKNVELSTGEGEKGGHKLCMLKPVLCARVQGLGGGGGKKEKLVRRWKGEIEALRAGKNEKPILIREWGLFLISPAIGMVKKKKSVVIPAGRDHAQRGGK